MPIVGFFMLLLATAIIVPCSGRFDPTQHKTSQLPGMVLSRPELWDITLFILLFVYPVISRKSVAAFGCVPYADGTHVLADDTSITCFEGEWMSYSYMAMGGTAFFCLGTPTTALTQYPSLSTARHGSLSQSVGHSLHACALFPLTARVPCVCVPYRYAHRHMAGRAYRPRLFLSGQATHLPCPHLDL
jgi:hypothetical protein